MNRNTGLSQDYCAGEVLPIGWTYAAEILSFSHFRHYNMTVNYLENF